MDSGKAARLAGWRRTLRVVCFLYIALLLIVKAPLALAVFKVVWHWYLASLRSRWTFTNLQSRAPVTVLCFTATWETCTCRPLVTKSFTSASGFALGDSLAQALQLMRYALPCAVCQVPLAVTVEVQLCICGKLLKGSQSFHIVAGPWCTMRSERSISLFLV